MKDQFIQALQNKNKVRLTFFSKEDGCKLTRLCAPMDFGPSRRAKDKTSRYHLWDYESDTKKHTLSLLPNQVESITTLEEKFDPSEFVTWDTATSAWFIPRNWGIYS